MFLGDMCKLKILRQGEVMTVEVKLDLVTSLVPTQLYDKRPRYVLTDCNTRTAHPGISLALCCSDVHYPNHFPAENY